MDSNSVFESAVTDTLSNLGNSQENENASNVITDTESAPVSDETLGENPSNDVVDDTPVDGEENSGDEVVENPLDLEEQEEAPSEYQKDSQAFARMRTELKEANNNLDAAKNVIQFFDVRAKQMGLNGIQELMEKTVESELNKQAQEKGVPVDVLRRLNELENRVHEQDIERDNLIRSQKEREVNHTFDTFMQNHSLSQQNITKLANDLVKDGFSFDALMNMPSSAVTKILNSYLPNDTLKQETLAKKEQIRKEVPVTGNTSSGSNGNDEIEKIAKMWASGGY